MASDFDLGGAIPAWGRSAAEYEAFFALSDIPASARVLDCGGGPASFTTQWSRGGRFVVAADPIYRFSHTDISANFESTASRMLEGARKAKDRFRWDCYGSPEGLVEQRREVLAAFISDFGSSSRTGRYVAGSLPVLLFNSEVFDLVF